MFPPGAPAVPPQLYRQPANQSPVRADPDDLLLLAGEGFQAGDLVIYRAIYDTTKPPTHPAQVPSTTMAEQGVAPVVSRANLPDSLTIRLPQITRVDQSYALWVRNAQGEWSDSVLINDARPLWFTPAIVYATGSFGAPRRELKVVGRNLEPSPGMTSRVQLMGPQTVTGTAIVDSRTSKVSDRYAARFKLPARLVPGRYRVRFSRDGRSWIDVREQFLEIRPDPPPPREFAISDLQFGGCRPDDGLDDTGCLLRAIAAAKSAGGGVVYFGPGTWDLVDSTPRPGLVDHEGVIVDKGISLRGAGVQLTRVDRHPEWNSRAATAAFTLIGGSAVSGIHFRDLQEYQASDVQHEVAGPYLQLGEDFARVASGSNIGMAASVDELVITHNIFDKTFIAIGDAGLPISRLFITENEFGAFYEALRLTGNRYNMSYPFRIDDSVFDDNTFKPGSLMDTPHFLGSIASELGAALRVDFSGNIADGSSVDYLYRADDPSGWRAAFFWSLNGNVEKLLVSGNSATCTGDKTGDGEGISFDDNGNTFAFPTVTGIARATASSLTLSVPLLARQNSCDIPVQSYYSDHWVQIVGGPGLGQVRKIKRYATDPSTGQTTFEVQPRWDVVPVHGKTRVAVGREYWQVYTVDNEVDHRKPLCKKSNTMRSMGGVIGMWAQAADSVIEGNRQFDTDGILTQQAYILPQKPCADCGMMGYFQYFLEIRANLIDGEYDWEVDCSGSGITTGIAAAPWDDPDPPTVAYGVSVSHNIIRHADATRGGAIAQVASWYAGPEPGRWMLSVNQLIHHNAISEVDGSRARAKCATAHGRIGISFPAEPIAWRTVLYANSCAKVSQPIEKRGGVETVSACPSSAADSCECRTDVP